MNKKHYPNSLHNVLLAPDELKIIKEIMLLEGRSMRWVLGQAVKNYIKNYNQRYLVEPSGSYVKKKD